MKPNDRVEICSIYHHTEGDSTEYDAEWQSHWVGVKFTGTVVTVEKRLRNLEADPLILIEFDEPIGRTICMSAGKSPQKKYMAKDWTMYQGELRLLK